MKEKNKIKQRVMVKGSENLSKNDERNRGRLEKMIGKECDL